jgi:hypothetical protein
VQTLAPRGHLQVTVRCECGDVFDITVRSQRRHQQAGTHARCQICRRRTAVIVSSVRYRNYWLKRFPPEWIAETAQMIWGER